MKMKNVRGGYILISLDMIDISDDDSVIKIDYSRLTESKKSIRLCNINVGGEHKPDIDIKLDFGENIITLSDVYGYDLIVYDDNSVLITEHRSAYELPIPEVRDAGKTIIVDSEGKYGLDDMPNELPIPESTDEGKIVTVDSEGKYALGDAPSGGTKLYRHLLSLKDSNDNDLSITMISTDSTPNTSYTGGPARLDKTPYDSVVSVYYNCYNSIELVTIREIQNKIILDIYHISSSTSATVASLTSDTVTEL